MVTPMMLATLILAAVAAVASVTALGLVLWLMWFARLFMRASGTSATKIVMEFSAFMRRQRPSPRGFMGR